MKNNRYKRRKCPLCKSMSGCLSDGTIKRYYCTHCSIEFTVGTDNNIASVLEIKSSGVVDEISNWEDYILYE